MAYLIINESSFLAIPLFWGSYDSLVESCFDYAWQREDECLFESMILNELSDELKQRAAVKALHQSIKSGENLSRAKNYLKMASYPLNRIDNKEIDPKIGLKDAKKELEVAKSFFKQGLAGTKRKRLLKYYKTIPEYTNVYDKSGKFLDVVSQKYFGHWADEGISYDTDPKVQKFINDIKSEINDIEKRIEKNEPFSIRVKNKIKRIIKALKKKYIIMRDRIKSISPEKRNLLQKFIYKITQMIDTLSGWISKTQ